MAASLRGVIERAFRAVEAKDLDGVLACFADDGVMVDPHYPTQRMVGKAAMADGLRWAFGGIRSFGFGIVGYWESADGGSAAVEVETHHVLRTGVHLRFLQVFVVDGRDGVIARMQAFTPYGPPGVGGMILGLTRLARLIGSLVRR